MKFFAFVYILIMLVSCSQPHKLPSGETADNNIETYKTLRCISDKSDRNVNADVFVLVDCDQKEIDEKTEKEYREYKIEHDIYTNQF